MKASTLCRLHVSYAGEPVVLGQNVSQAHHKTISASVLVTTTTAATTPRLLLLLLLCCVCQQRRVVKCTFEQIVPCGFGCVYGGGASWHVVTASEVLG